MSEIYEGVDDEFNKMALDQSLEGTIRNRSRGLLHEPMIPSDDGTKALQENLQGLDLGLA
jgi:hypothetical protein